MSQDNDLGPALEPEIEPREPNPGGVDAITYSDGAEAAAEQGLDAGGPALRDLDPDSNPAVEDALPDEMKEGEDTSTEATKSDEGSAGSDVDPEEESPA